MTIKVGTECYFLQTLISITPGTSIPALIKAHIAGVGYIPSSATSSSAMAETVNIDRMNVMTDNLNILTSYAICLNDAGIITNASILNLAAIKNTARKHKNNVLI